MAKLDKHHAKNVKENETHEHSADCVPSAMVRGRTERNRSESEYWAILSIKRDSSRDLGFAGEMRQDREKPTSFWLFYVTTAFRPDQFSETLRNLKRFRNAHFLFYVAEEPFFCFKVNIPDRQINRDPHRNDPRRAASAMGVLPVNRATIGMKVVLHSNAHIQPAVPC